jgi:hypothetical protein
MIDLARRVVDVMTRAMLSRRSEDHAVLLAAHAWERPSPHTGGWRL